MLRNFQVLIKRWNFHFLIFSQLIFRISWRKKRPNKTKPKLSLKKGYHDTIYPIIYILHAIPRRYPHLTSVSLASLMLIIFNRHYNTLRGVNTEGRKVPSSRKTNKTITLRTHLNRLNVHKNRHGRPLYLTCTALSSGRYTKMAFFRDKWRAKPKRSIYIISKTVNFTGLLRRWAACLYASRVLYIPLSFLRSIC